MHTVSDTGVTDRVAVHGFTPEVTVPDDFPRDGLTEKEVKRLYRFAKLYQDELHKALYGRDSTANELRQFSEEFRNAAERTYHRLNWCASRFFAGNADDFDNDETQTQVAGLRSFAEQLISEIKKVEDLYNLYSRWQEQGTRVKDVLAAIDRLPDEELCSLREIYVNLYNLQLSMDFDDVQIVFKEDGDAAQVHGAGSRQREHTDRVVVTTKDCSVEFDGITVPLGKQCCTLTLDGLHILIGTEQVNQFVQVRPQTFDYVPRGTDNIFHPHVDSFGVMCTGEGQAPLKHAIRRGLLADAFTIVNAILNTYNDDSPLNSIDYWTQADLCNVCGSYVQANEETVEVTRSGVVIHRGCSVEYEGEVYPRGEIRTCPVCRETQFPVDLGRVTTTAGALVCQDCYPLIREEEEAVANGEFVCPVCRNHYGTDEAEGARVTIRPSDYACTACATVVTEKPENISQEEWDSEQARLHNRLDEVSRPPVMVHIQHQDINRIALIGRSIPCSRPTPRPIEHVPCDCGARVPRSSLREGRCVFTGQTLCIRCDPDQTGYGGMFWSDRSLLEGYLQMQYARLNDEQGDTLFRDCVSLLSFEVDDVPVEEAAAIVKQLMHNPLSYSLIYSRPLASAVAAVNPTISPVSTRTLASFTVDEEEFYDRELQFRIQRNPERLRVFQQYQRQQHGQHTSDDFDGEEEEAFNGTEAGEDGEGYDREELY